MLERHFGAPAAVEELASLGLIQARGWANGPGMIWIPTAAGEALYRELADGRRAAAVPAGQNAGSLEQSGTGPNLSCTADLSSPHDTRETMARRGRCPTPDGRQASRAAQKLGRLRPPST